MRLRAIAIPAEHGGWGFLLEPIVLGLLVAPSLAGAYLALAAASAFLSRQPLRIALVDWRRGKRHERTVLAQRVGLIYVAIAVLGGAAAVQAAGVMPLLPLLLAAPAFLVFLIHDVQRRGRDLLPELAGPTALAAVASSIAVAGGWSVIEALPLWVVLVARALPSVHYVRARLRLGRGQAANVPLVFVTHFAGLAVVAALAWAGLLPLLAIVALGVLLLRAIICLSPYCPSISTRTIGFLELGLGALTVVLVAAGYRLAL